MTDEGRPFAKAAEHYLRGRPPYSPQLVDVMRTELGLDGTGALVDVGCGPGRLAVQLAPLFDVVIGIDPEPAMLDEARRHCANHDVEVKWIEARAEDLASLALPAPRLVTFGQAIHWTDRQPVLATVHELLQPGGAVALIAPAIEHGTPPHVPPAPPIPHDQVEALRPVRTCALVAAWQPSASSSKPTSWTRCTSPLRRSSSVGANALWNSHRELLDRFELDSVPSPSGVTHLLFWRR